MTRKSRAMGMRNAIMRNQKQNPKAAKMKRIPKYKLYEGVCALRKLCTLKACW